VARLDAHGRLIPLTIPVALRLVYRLVMRFLAPPEAVLHWSRWRRLHQACAKRTHYQRRLTRQLPSHQRTRRPRATWTTSHLI
jgi:hypothetical protein